MLFRRAPGIAALLAALALTAALPARAGAPAGRPRQPMPPDMLLDAGPGRQRPAVPFAHAGHQGLADCQACHHLTGPRAKDWNPGDTTRCADCHDAAKTGRGGLRHAFHTQCLGCHQQAVTSEKKAAPLACGGCHLPTAQTGGAS